MSSCPLHLLQTLRFGADHARRVNLYFQLAARQLFDPFRHHHHRFVHRVVRRQPVSELQDPRAVPSAALRGAHAPGVPQRQHQHGDQAAAEQPRCPL